MSVYWTLLGLKRIQSKGKWKSNNNLNYYVYLWYNLLCQYTQDSQYNTNRFVNHKTNTKINSVTSLDFWQKNPLSSRFSVSLAFLPNCVDKAKVDAVHFFLAGHLRKQNTVVKWEHIVT